MPFGEALVLWTVRVALVFFVAALLMRPASRRGRVFWTAGCLWYLAHVAAAFHVHHGWSHTTAYEYTARRSAEVVGLDWGGGLWWNYAFTVVWVSDVVWMWLRPASYGARSSRWNGAIYGFLGFMSFNATVVFATGVIRWAGVAATLLVLSALLARHRR